MSGESGMLAVVVPPLAAFPFIISARRRRSGLRYRLLGGGLTGYSRDDVTEPVDEERGRLGGGRLGTGGGVVSSAAGSPWSSYKKREGTARISKLVPTLGGAGEVC